MLSKSSLCFMIKSVSWFKLLWTSSDKSKWKILGSLVIKSLLSPVCTFIILSLSYHWLNYCKVFWWLYYVDTEYIVFVWFRFLVCMTSFQLLFVLVILEALLVVCSELRFLFHFLFFDFLIFPLSVFYFSTLFFIFPLLVILVLLFQQ